MKNILEIKINGYCFRILFDQEKNKWKIGSVPGIHSFNSDQLRIYIDSLEFLQIELDKRNNGVL